MRKLVLFCFPYAGGSGAIFHHWSKYLHPSIELCPIDYAGRGKRFQESFYQNMNEAIDDLFDVVHPFISKNHYSFFGHSLGGLIAYELCKKVASESCRPPEHLFLSGIKAPNQLRKKKIHHLPEKEFKEELLELNGTPLEVLNNQELMNLFIPVLRSDFKLIEEYEGDQVRAKINTSITALYGDKDNMSRNDMMKWRDFTAKDSRIICYPGGHFFIREHYKEIIKLINCTLAERGDIYEYSNL
ncbi:thioesterase II family protein [Metabacillus sp. Hm71]|uniref:thioesterase II family protein n=1 Tax=Metabacillus sp. Hm71 TaxID=3450743 RepID=UPI003F427F71